MLHLYNWEEILEFKNILWNRLLPQMFKMIDRYYMVSPSEKVWAVWQFDIYNLSDVELFQTFIKQICIWT